jgi:hypothetical protein
LLRRIFFLGFKDTLKLLKNSKTWYKGELQENKTRFTLSQIFQDKKMVMRKPKVVTCFKPQLE